MSDHDRGGRSAHGLLYEAEQRRIRDMIEDVKRESVDHPDHYGGDVAYEAIKIIEAHSLGFHLGNAVKYILRAEKKGGTVDLQKALWYIQREISNREEEPDHVTIERLWREERSG